MKKFCKNCRKEYRESVAFCPDCGGMLEEREEEGVKSFAEWGANPYAAIAAETEEEKESRKKRQRKEKVLSRRKTLFSLAFVSLLLDFLCGIGCFIGVFVAAVATGDYRFLIKEEKKRSTQLIWAMTVGYVATALGLLFFILML